MCSAAAGLLLLGVRFACTGGLFCVRDDFLELCSGFSKVLYDQCSKAQSTGVWGPPPLSGRPEGPVRVRLSRVYRVSRRRRAGAAREPRSSGESLPGSGARVGLVRGALREDDSSTPT